MKNPFLSLCLLFNLLSASVSPAEILMAGQNSGVSLAYSAQTSATDLINSGQSTLSSATVSATASTGFPSTGINDGSYSTTNSKNTFFRTSYGNFPATATYDLNLSVNTLGYDITSVKSFMGYATVSAVQANQTYTIELSYVGSAAFTTYGTVSYKPFADINQPIYESFVSVTDSSGVIASGVDAIRITFTDPVGPLGVANDTGTNEGTVIREIDVIGSPTAGAPGPPVKLAVASVNGGVNPVVGAEFDVVVRAQDEAGIPRDVTDATAVSLSLKSGTGSLGGTLDGTIAAGTSSVTFSGVTYSVAEGGVALTATRTAGDSLTAGDSAAFTVDMVPLSTTISSPTSRHIVQRSSGNTGTIDISGDYAGTPEIIEARAVVMSGAGDTGTTTSWQTIHANPAGGRYSGSLTDVPAGGWYRLEVRPVTGGSPETPATLEKIGVGDIYVTAGQSNSANSGNPPYTPTDDRVSARLVVGADSWRHAYDPQPIATRTGGSVWSRLGDLLASADNIPIGFVSVGQGGTQASQWVPGTPNYDNLLKPAIQTLGADGFRAVLWHQGESDSVASVSSTTHAGLLNSMIGQSRIDGGWAVPWYVAEVSFLSTSRIYQEEPVCAGQRMVIYGDANVFIGPTTDAFHLEDAAGGKLIDGVHFNAKGLLDHATQWRDILRGTTTANPRNGDFEDNRDPDITGLAALADGAFLSVNTLTDTDSPSVLGWRILSSSGLDAADGANGIHNPTTGTYARAVDTINGGILPGMSGRHVATFDGGTAENHFLHTTRALVKPDSNNLLTVAIGVRDDATTFGGARIDILANGQTVATATYDKAALDALRGGDSAGTFTNVSINYQTGATVVANQPLAVRITKISGSGTVLDFDNVRFTVAPTGYSLYRDQYLGGSIRADSAPDADRDHDGLPNGIEYFIGSNPTIPNPPPEISTVTEDGRSWSHLAVPLNPAVTDIGLILQYSFDLTAWHAAATTADGTVVSVRQPELWTIEIAQDSHSRAFFRLFLDQILPGVPSP